MRKWSNIDNLDYLNTCTVYGTDSGLAAVTGTLNVCLNLAQTQIVSDLCTILCCHLGGVRSVLLTATETHLAGRRPGDYLTLAVSQRHDDIIEGTVNMQLTESVNLHISFLCCNCFLCHISIII